MLNFFSFVFHSSFKFSTFIPQNDKGQNFFPDIIDGTTIKVLIIVYNCVLETNCEEKVKHFERRQRNVRLAISLQAPWRRVIPLSVLLHGQKMPLWCVPNTGGKVVLKDWTENSKSWDILSSNCSVKRNTLKRIGTLSRKPPV